MLRVPPSSTRTDTLVPDTTLFRSVGAVVDVRAQRVQRDATVRVHLGARHLGATEATADLDLAALGARAHRAGERALHRTTERDTVLKLFGDRLRDRKSTRLNSSH